jgi:salicylate hydroxylase
MSEPFHVLIIGGGIGGLTLAQGLKRAGISAAVYERDRTLTDRLQGYRVHISPTGSLALHECLPAHLFEVFDRTCGAPNIAVRFFTEQMRVLLAFDGDLVASTDPVARHRAASRITLRQVLLAELDDVHFGKSFQHYEQRGEHVAAYFEDGTSAEGDVLVAADGGGSRVRRHCRTRSASTPAWPASRGKSFSMSRVTGSRGRCSTVSASSPHAAGSGCSLRFRR